jgi:opacity protein-like surface antigen
MRRLLLLATIAMGAGAVRAGSGLVYVGAGVTSNNVDVSSTSLPGAGYNPFPDISGTSWQAFAGVRPISPIAFEVDYFEFGSATSTYDSPLSCVGSGACGSTAHSNAKAVAADAVWFLPIPLPMLDIYAKAGLARFKLERSGSMQSGGGIANPGAPITTTYYSFPDDSTVLAWGAGLQLHLGMIGGRLEYEGLGKASTSVFALSLYLQFL